MHGNERVPGGGEGGLAGRQAEGTEGTGALCKGGLPKVRESVLMPPRATVRSHR